MHNPYPLCARVKQKSALGFKGVKEMTKKNSCGSADLRTRRFLLFALRFLFKIVEIVLKIDAVWEFLRKISRG